MVPWCRSYLEIISVRSCEKPPGSYLHDFVVILCLPVRHKLEQEESFVDNIRYKYLTCEDWILSRSNWRDEKSLVRWHTRRRRHEGQQRGRDEILAAYHQRVGQITSRGDVLRPHVDVGVLLRERARPDAVDDNLVPSEASDGL